MIQSMTGYGKAVVTYKEKKINVEIKSLNSKSLDLSTRIAPLYREKEMEMRQMVSAALVRGKIDLNVWIEKEAGADATPINGALVENYFKQIKEIAEKVGFEVAPDQLLPTLMRMPDVLAKTEVETLTDEEWAAVKQALKQSIDAITEFRRQEGAALQKKFTEKIEIRQRIVGGLSSIPEVEYDKNRLEQELIYYIEKLDISEEKQRLTNHLRYFRETMEQDDCQGKKLGFIAQEMGREINTTGSKSNQAEMQNIVVKMKDELEQIKEQVLNAL